MVQKSSGKVYFGVDARHIRQLGQELVGDRITAITELVKNAYDADATEVSAEFDLGGPGKITIKDNGHGMTLDDLRRSWMRLSTPEKDDHPVSPAFSRKRSGRKGIGRFATETLGRTLELASTVAGEPIELRVTFAWDDFPSGADLETIGSTYETHPAPRELSGTTLVISGLRHPWSDGDFDSVSNSLLLLQPPFPVAETAGERRDPGFRVKLLTVADGVLEPAASAYNDFINAATANIQIKVTESTAEMRVTAPMFDLDEVLPMAYPELVGPLSAEASYYVFRQDTLGSIKVRAAQAMGRNYGGIRLYRDGLRVMPYGEPGVDWLGLDELQGSRSSTLTAIRNQNWFGQVLIERDRNPDLIDTASREGLVQNLAYRQLRGVLRDALVHTAERVAAARGRKGRTDTKPDQQRSRAEVLVDTQRELLGEVSTQLPAQVASKVSSIVERTFRLAGQEASLADSEEIRQIESLAGEVELLRILASLGTSIAVFNHEVQNVLDSVSAAYAAIRVELGEPVDSSPIADKLRDGELSLERMTSLAEYVNSYVSVSQRREREPQPVFAVIEDFVDGLTGSLARGVDVRWTVKPRALRTEPMTRSELETVLINLLTNAVKAMNQEGMVRRKVDIEARAEGTFVVIRFQDTGVGVEPSIRDRIFDPFVSDSRRSVNALGIGTGLGLKIVADIIENYGGSIQLGEPDSGYATCFEARVPRWRRQVSG